MQQFLEISDYKGVLKMEDIPVLSYPDFLILIDDLLADNLNRCITYFAVPGNDDFRFFCLAASDETRSIKIFSHRQKNVPLPELESITQKHFQFHVFERDIHEKYGISFKNHPWMKPLRFPARSENKTGDYPFYSIEGTELHEVGVGPVHAGIIEPGHFRFICNGEKVIHLEIRLGYQHRGIEKLFVTKESLLERIILSESIAGDTTLGHAVTNVTLMESLGSVVISKDLFLERMIALEMERIAVHIGDTAALCTDTAFQFGQVVNEALRTIVINTMQLWCGNRFGKGLIRTGGTHYPLSPSTIEQIRKNLKEVMERYDQMAEKLFTMPSVLNRFEGTGRITKNQVSLIGAVGMTSRSTGLKRDARVFLPYREITGEEFSPITFEEGDVWARGMIRRKEVRQSYELILKLLNIHGGSTNNLKPLPDIRFQTDSLAFALTEGWRGEICHVAVTDKEGKISSYVVKDPSLNNWMALALSLRNEEISDFPLCNKSFNLSYCGNDL